MGKWDIDNEVVYWDVDKETSIDPATEWDEGNHSGFTKWEKTGKMTALVDADMFPYIVGYCHSEEAWFNVILKCRNEGLNPDTDEGKEYMLTCPETAKVIDHVHTVADDWVTRSGADSARFFLTDGSLNYRDNLAFSRKYKDRGSSKPAFFSLTKWYIEKYMEAEVGVTEEADDLMAIAQYQGNEVWAMEGAKQGSQLAKRWSNTVIVTKDKDLRMIAGWHSNPDINDGEKFWVDSLGWLEPTYYPEGHKLEGKMKDLKGAGMLFFYAQMLMGDSVDTYNGLAGCGMVKAYAMLKDCKKIKAAHEVVKTAFFEKFGDTPFRYTTWDEQEVTIRWQDIWLEQGRLAWMQTRKGEMWEPNSIWSPDIDAYILEKEIPF